MSQLEYAVLLPTTIGQLEGASCLARDGLQKVV